VGVARVGYDDNRSGLPASICGLPFGIADFAKKAARPLAGGLGGRETWPQRTRVGLHGVSRASRASGSMLPRKE
jgi:hypothetical protein